MDCDKFESVMIDELYGELDALASADAKDHLSGCLRCSDLVRKLRATRRLSAIPTVPPPVSLEQRILQRIDELPSSLPPRRRVARLVSAAGSWAMRPQTAMAAVFLVMIGTSLLLLRERSSRAPASSEMTVTQEGVPALAPPAPTPPRSDIALEEPGQAKEDAPTARPLLARETQAGAAPPPTEGPNVATLAAAKGATDDGRTASREAPAAAPAVADRAESVPERKDQSDGRFGSAMEAYRAGHFAEAARDFDAIPDRADAALWAARATREADGCGASVARFDGIAERADGQDTGWTATFEAARCYRALGDVSRAHDRLVRLTKVPSFKDRAQSELDALDRSTGEAGRP